MHLTKQTARAESQRGEIPAEKPAFQAERWYVAATKPAREQYACLQLRNQRFEPFLPLLRRTIRTGRRMIDRREAYFPGYVFLRLNLADPNWKCINSTRGIRRLIMSGETPLPLPLGFVEALQARSGADGMLRPGDDLQAGDRVKIVSGPFTDLIGTLHNLESRGRLSVLVSLLNGTVPVVLERDHLIPAA